MSDVGQKKSHGSIHGVFNPSQASNEYEFELIKGMKS